MTQEQAEQVIKNREDRKMMLYGFISAFIVMPSVAIASGFVLGPIVNGITSLRTTRTDIVRHCIQSHQETYGNVSTKAWYYCHK